MIWRLCEDAFGLFEGSCISEERFKGVYYTDRCLFEPIPDKEGLIELLDEEFCKQSGIDCLLFYSNKELSNFQKKRSDAEL